MQIDHPPLRLSAKSIMQAGGRTAAYKEEAESLDRGNSNDLRWKSDIETEGNCRPEAALKSVTSDGPSQSCAGLAPFPVPTKRRRSLKILGDVVVEPQHCFDALTDYTSHEVQWGKIEQENASVDLKQLWLRAMKHLSAEGWKFRYVMGQEKQELQYGAPTGEVFGSLFAACKFCLDETRVFCQTSASSRHLKSDFDRKKLSNGQSTSTMGVRNAERSCSKEVKEENVIVVHNSTDLLFLSKRKPKNTLSWLIEDDVLSPEEGVNYILGKEVMTTGKVNPDGIQCHGSGTSKAISENLREREIRGCSSIVAAQHDIDEESQEEWSSLLSDAEGRKMVVDISDGEQAENSDIHNCLEFINKDGGNDEGQTVDTSQGAEENQFRWHYTDPNGDTQGPFPIRYLRSWKEKGFFDENFSVWRSGQDSQEAILLNDLLL